MARPAGPVYCLGIVHAPPGTASYDALPPRYALTRDQLRLLATRIPGSPLTVEHNGIHAAIARSTGPQGHLATRDRIIAELHDLGESDATKSPVGTIVDARVIEPEGGLYVIAQISEGLTGLAHLVRSGFMTGLSLSTVENHTGLVPVEVSLTSDPARPHSYIVHSSSSYERAQDYLRGIETGTLRDYSASLTKPTRVMAASKQQMEVETPAEAPKDTATEPPQDNKQSSMTDAEALLKAIQNHPDATARSLLTASLGKMGDELIKKNDAEAQNREKIRALEADLKKAQDRAKIDTALLRSELTKFRSALPKPVAEEYDPELEKEAMATTDASVVRAAWNQQLVTASYASMHARIAADADRTGGRSKRSVDDMEAEEPDVTAERMAAINTLLSASAAHVAPSGESDGAGPAVPEQTTSSMTAEQQRMAAAMKLATALDAFN